MDRNARSPLSLLATASLAVGLLFAAGPAGAQVVTSARDTIATISFSDLAFDDARVRLDATQTIAAGSSGSKNVRFDAATDLESFALSSSGQVDVALNSFTPPSSFDLTVSASGAGSWSIAERYGVSYDYFAPEIVPLYRYTEFNDYFAPFVNNTLPALELTLYIGGLVDVGGRFGIGFVIPGDWSTTGDLASTTGQHFLYGLDRTWLIDTDFVYDRDANVTRFHATNPGYEGLDSKHPSPFLDVYFFGSTVPEPGSWAMMIAGFGAVGLAMRRRGRRIASPSFTDGGLLVPAFRRS